MPELYNYQKETIANLKGDRHIAILSTGTGKGPISMVWAEKTGKDNVLIVTTASKRDSHDFETEADVWCGAFWREGLSSFTVISWEGLAKWYKANGEKINWNDWCVVFDEIAKGKAGVSSKRGRTFLKIANKTKCWTGYTATPGDRWIDFYAYFTATGKVRNKTEFINKFCNMQTFKGYPEIVSYFNTDVLQSMWDEISYRPDTSEMFKELPDQIHEVIHFKQPVGYKDVIKTQHKLTGELLETTMAFCMYLRQMCLTKAKKQWIADFLESLGDNAVFFVNFIEEENELEEIATKLGIKVWRIDGSHHDIPTKDTIGKTDIVVANYGAGAEGLNLQFMHYWVSVSPNYSYSVSIQARGRIKRIGQENTMFYYYLKCDKTIEDGIYETLKNKSDFSEKTWSSQYMEE